MASENGMSELWVRMAEAYGEHWSRNYGDEVTDSWRAVLSRFGDDDVAAGWLAAVESGSPFPPTLPEFREHCLVACRNRVRALPPPELPELTPELRADNLRRLADVRSKLAAKRLN